MRELCAEGLATSGVPESRRGGFLLVRRTIGKRMQAKLKQIRAQLRKRMHQPVLEQGKWLGSVVRGYFAYSDVGQEQGLFVQPVQADWLS